MSDDHGARELVAPLPTGAESVAHVQAAVARMLGVAGVPDPADEARDLIAAVLDEARFWPIANRDAPLSAELRERIRVAAHRRASGMPFAYAVGRAAFRHLTLAVDERVLIPRQETEQLVEELLAATAARAGGIAVDVGTGSGAIALSLAVEGRFDRIIATDVSLGALAVARRNAAQLYGALGCAVEFRSGSLLAPLRGIRARAIVSNPPYIAPAEAPRLPRSVRDWEPPLALFSGTEGMSATIELVRGAADLLEPGGVLALELDSRRAALAAEAAAADDRYSEVSIRLDLAGRERILLATRM